VSIGRLPVPAQAVPHRGDALLLDALLHADEDRLSAAVTVRPGTAFSERDGSLPGWAGPELMAEAVAAYAGCRSLREKGRTAPIGLILGIRDYQCAVARFETGEALVVDAVRSSEDEEGRGVFDCRISSGGRLLASGMLTVYQPPDSTFLDAERLRDE
jgi:predicted hotdog family 3-hydroxylacyl-ACP dehydratase